MQLENRIARGLAVESPSVAPLSVIAGGLFVLYALSKGYLTTVIVAEGWRFAGMSPEMTALLVHVFEGLLLEVMALGLASFHVRSGPRGRLTSAGITITLAGFGLTIVSHVGEHIAGIEPAPVLGSGQVVWLYYASWLVLYVGLATYGVALVVEGNAAGRLPYLFVSLLPLVVAVGFVTVLLGVFTLAGTFRVALGLTWLLVGPWFRSGRVLHPSARAQAR